MMIHSYPLLISLYKGEGRVLIENDVVEDSVIVKMIEYGNQVYYSIAELKEAVGIR